MIAKLIKIALMAGIALALASTLSCGQHDFWNDVVGSSDSKIVHGEPVCYEGETYETVVIGSQTWMARNMNYDAKGSKCYCGRADQTSGFHIAYDCNTFGRLYDWPTAMDLPSNCNSTSCASQVSSKHRGICPPGWYIPSKADWDKLTSYVESDNNCSGCDAEHLKVGRWTFQGVSVRESKNTYGFAALPGGGGFGPSEEYNNESCHGGGEKCHWWSSIEYSNAAVYIRTIDYDQTRWYNDNKNYLYSVRCLKDDSQYVPQSSNSCSKSSSSRQSGVIREAPVDYEGKTYETVKIGNQIWMAENLNYAVSGSKCYDNKESNCDKYGRLYDWQTATGISNDYKSNIKYRGICPFGWHIPSQVDWDELMRYADGLSVWESPYKSPIAGKYLKATSGWNNNGNGQDTYGFAALPGGFSYPEDGGSNSGKSYDAGNFGLWWIANELYYFRRMYQYGDGVDWDFSASNKRSFFSVRCLKD